MEQGTGLILAANGKPFSDQDAARIKAQVISHELGEPYNVISHPSGGYAIRRVDNAGQTVSEKKPAANEKPPSTNTAFSQTRGPTSQEIGGENPFNIQSPIVQTRERPVSISRPSAGPIAIDRNIETDVQFRTLVLRPAWRGFWKLHILGFAGLVVALAPTGFLLHILHLPPEHVSSISRHGMIPLLSFLGLTASLTAFAYAVYGRYAYRFTAKPELLESCFGIFARKSVRAEYAHIRSIDVDQGIIDRILNVGTVEVSTAATADAEVIFQGISDPMAMQEEISRRRRHGKAGRLGDE